MVSIASACGDDDVTDPPVDASADSSDVDGGADANVDAGPPPPVPLDMNAPWPKFRANPEQTGRVEIDPVDNGAEPWMVQTGKGIFSTPVIDGDGNVYIGSADRFFYAIDPAGEVMWRFETGEIIDSSALLDDQDRIYFGSGDGTLYALDKGGNEVWTFDADDPATNNALINWFEGNVAIGVDGTLYVPNDNFCTYAIDRDTGEKKWCFETADQTWSLPALNPATGKLFMGNNFLLAANIYSINADDGRRAWNATTAGSVAASPMITGFGEDDLVVVGSFDGFLYAYRQNAPAEVWTFGARDHIYASPGQLSDGTIIQPAADGTIYAINPETGTPIWSFDTREPIRSSPAIDGNDQIYVGSGEGRLFVLEPDGNLRWSIGLIDSERDDLNASPALGDNGVVIAGESGGIFYVPFDYCLRENLDDARCVAGPAHGGAAAPGESLAGDEVFFGFTTQFGRLMTTPPTHIDANDPLSFSLFVREGGDTELTAIDSTSLAVEGPPGIDFDVEVAGDRKFLVITPNEPWTAAAGGEVSFRITGDYLVNLTRDGIKFSGGTRGGSFDQMFSFMVNERSGAALTLPFPTNPGDDSAVFEMSRLAAPLPTILPSYNQIGFDSIHYLVGIVEGTADRAIAWGVGATPTGPDGATVIDPNSDVRFALIFEYDRGNVTMENRQGFTIEFNGFSLPFEFFRVSTTMAPNGDVMKSPAIATRAVCSDVPIYGPFIQSLGYCNPDSDVIMAYGAAELAPHEGGTQTAPSGLWDNHTASVEPRMVDDEERQILSVALTGGSITAADHNIGILLIDPNTNLPIVADYVNGTEAVDGEMETTAELDVTGLPAGEARVYVMLDTYPAYRTTVMLP